MKLTLVALLLALFSAALVSSASHHKRDESDNDDNDEVYKYGNNDNDNDDNGNDDNDDDDDEDDDDDDDDGSACMMQLLMCSQLLPSYDMSNFSETTNDMRDVGPRQLCTDMTAATDCAAEAYLTEECGKIPKNIDRLILKTFDIVQLVCLDKLDEIEAHWDCYLSAEVDEELEDCQGLENAAQQCDSSPFIRCAEHSFAASPRCNEGALELVTDIVNELMKLIPNCSEQKKWARIMRSMFKK